MKIGDWLWKRWWNVRNHLGFTRGKGMKKLGKNLGLVCKDRKHVIRLPEGKKGKISAISWNLKDLAELLRKKLQKWIVNGDVPGKMVKPNWFPGKETEFLLVKNGMWNRSCQGTTRGWDRSWNGNPFLSPSRFKPFRSLAIARDYDGDDVATCRWEKVQTADISLG